MTPFRRMQKLDDGQVALLREQVTPKLAHNVLFAYDHADQDAGVGYPGSQLVQALLTAVRRADPDNRRKLARGYPGLVRACEAIELYENGASVLREIALVEAQVAPSEVIP